MKQGQYPIALDYYERSREILEKYYHEDYSSLAPTYSNMGSIYEDMGDYCKVLQYKEKSFKLLKRSLPEHHPYIAKNYQFFTICYNNMANIYLERRDYRTTLEYFEHTLSILEHSRPSDYSKIAYFEKAIQTLRQILFYF